MEEDSLKYYILYMASVNHLLSAVAVRGFSWSIAKKMTAQTGVIQRQVLEINGLGTSIKGKALLTGNLIKWIEKTNLH